MRNLFLSFSSSGAVATSIACSDAPSRRAFFFALFFAFFFALLLGFVIGSEASIMRRSSLVIFEAIGLCSTFTAMRSR